MNLGPHADFIIVSYVLTVLVVGALVAWIAVDYAAQRRILGQLDQRGVRRRSQPTPERAP